jgi:hypothetical protein
MSPRKRERGTKGERVDVPAPIGEAAIAERFVAEAAEKVPAKLRDLEVAPLEPYAKKAVTREKLAKLRVDTSEPMRPAWVASRARPAKAPRPLVPRPIDHRGRLLQRGLVFAPDDPRPNTHRSYPGGTI